MPTSPEEVTPVDAQEFAKGDRVRATYGGPVMTVEEVYAPAFAYRYRCVWHDPDGNPQHELFRPEQLERATDRPAG
jgi:uncharacterized protein YodC (DUF2158 family)